MYLWVLNEEQDFDRAFDKLGATGVMTDYPTLLTKYLDEKDEKKQAVEAEQARPLLPPGN